MAGKHDRIIRINSQAQWLLPKAFEDWMDQNMPVYIMYESGRKEGRCTRCGVISEYKKLRYNKKAKCPHCGKTGVAKTKKRLVGKKTSRKFVYIQKIKNGILCRFIEREYSFCEDGTIEKSLQETLRAAVEKGCRQYWYEKRNRYSPDTWCENRVKWCVRTENSPMVRIAGYGGWSYRYENLGVPKIYRRNKKGIINDSQLRYFSDNAEDLIEKVYKKSDYRSAISAFLDVYEAIHRYPCLEALYKCGLEDLVVDYICHPKIKLNCKEREPHKILGLSKELFREIRKKKKTWYQENVAKLTILQNVTHEIPLIIKLEESLDRREIKLFFGEYHMSPKKTLRYVDHISGKNKYVYIDYITMAGKAGSDMTSDFVLYPGDLEAAHDAMIEVRREQQNRELREKAKKKDKAIQKVYEKIQKNFSFEGEKYMMCPARSNEEIVTEGQKQHTCVWNGRYTDKMIKGESYILFIREKKQPDKPYYTVEITPDYEIIQRHGKYNKEGEEVKEVDAFLRAFLREVGHVEVDYAV